LFLQQSPDVIHLPFAGTSGAYASTAGEVQWSDQKQQGYLVLENLPANDPTQQQYQLWIVDPQRDEIPVDGGLFDVVSPTPETVVIEIHAKLAIQRPKAFVITVEQPGGVVRSKQKIVVGIAKALP
jgi:anti-sigma-K factor RskA